MKSLLNEQNSSIWKKPVWKNLLEGADWEFYNKP